MQAQKLLTGRKACTAHLSALSRLSYPALFSPRHFSVLLHLDRQACPLFMYEVAILLAFYTTSNLAD